VFGDVVVVSPKGDGTASNDGAWDDEWRAERCEEVDAIESKEVRGCNRECSLFCSSSSSSSSSGWNDAASSYRSFRSSRGSSDEKEGGREEGGVLTWADDDDCDVLSILLLRYSESSFPATCSKVSTFRIDLVDTLSYRLISPQTPEITCKAKCK
jgi:hypothetical protein